MRLQRESNGQIITLDPSLVLGEGGEARVYALPQDRNLVAKIYHQPTDMHARKLATMLANPPIDPMIRQGHVPIVWPIDLLRTPDTKQRILGFLTHVIQGQIVGFLMPRVARMHPILNFYNPTTRRQQCPLFNYRYLHRTALNLATAVHILHTHGYVIGDMNESNILVTETALITLLDTDSFQVRDPKNGGVYRCSVGKPEFTPPELQGKSFARVNRKPVHDLFGLAVLIFLLLMEGTHPFAGVFAGRGEPPSYGERIAAGHFPYGRNRRVPYIRKPLAPPVEILDPTLHQLFIRCFEDGYKKPWARPDAQTWQNALKEAEKNLLTCSANSQHLYGNHLPACPWCERTALLGGRDPFPSLQAVQSGQHLRPPRPTQTAISIPIPVKPRKSWRENRTIRALGFVLLMLFRLLPFIYQKSGVVIRKVIHWRHRFTPTYLFRRFSILHMRGVIHWRRMRTWIRHNKWKIRITLALIVLTILLFLSN